MLYNPPSGSSDANAPYVGKNVAAGTQGSKVPPAALEFTQRELVAIIAASNQSPTNAVLVQGAMALARGVFVGNLTGSGDLAVATLGVVFPSLLQGMRIGAVATAQNTGTAPKLRVVNLGSAGAFTDFPIVKEDGSAPAAGEIKVGRRYRYEADGAGNMVITGGGIAGDASGAAQAAGSPFNSRPVRVTARAALQGNQAGVPSTAFSGLTYTKQLAGSRLVINGKFQTRSNASPGNGNGAQYFLFNVGSGFVRHPLNNGYPSASAGNTLFGVITDLPKGDLAVSGVMQREDNLQWYTTFLPTSADESGYPPVNLADFTIHEEA